MKQHTGGQWISIAEAARLLGLSRAAVYKAVSEKRLAARRWKVTRHILRISRRSLHALLQTPGLSRRPLKRRPQK